MAEGEGDVEDSVDPGDIDVPGGIQGIAEAFDVGLAGEREKDVEDVLGDEVLEKSRRRVLLLSAGSVYSLEKREKLERVPGGKRSQRTSDEC